MNNGLKQAIAIAGNKSALARQISAITGKNLTPQAVHKWCEAGMVPLGRVVDVEQATGVRREKLRPDFFRSNHDSSLSNPSSGHHSSLTQNEQVTEAAQ